MADLIVTGLRDTEVNFSNLSASHIDYQDIVHRLNHINRFNGGTVHPYSVLKHSFAMQQTLRSRGATARQQQLALMHDMTEAYMGDMVSPLKVLFPKFKEMEDELFNIICRELNIANDFTEEDWRVVKSLDKEVRLVEWYVLNQYRIIDHAGAWAAEYPDFTMDAELTKHVQNVVQTSTDLMKLRFETIFGTVRAQAEAQRVKEAE